MRTTPEGRPPAAQRIATLRRKYDELWTKHQATVRASSCTIAERAGVFMLSTFALRVSGAAFAIADRKYTLFRNRRWNALERDRTRWRATARDAAAPAGAATLGHLATDAARALLARRAPASAAGRYERPDRGDVFDVRFERLEDRELVGVAIRDVTRLVTAERELALAKRALRAICSDPELARAALEDAPVVPTPRRARMKR